MGPANGIPTAAEFGQLVAWLRTHRPAGTPANELNQRITQVIGGNPNGRTRQQIADELRDFVRTLPKATT